MNTTLTRDQIKALIDLLAESSTPMTTQELIEALRS